MPRGRADKVSQPGVDLDLGLAAVDVSYKGRPVGKLAATSEGPLAFEYDNEWLAKGFSISPLSLPLTPGVSVAKPEPLSGVFGVFDDSLPDGWGRLLVDRMLRANGIEPCNVSPLVRLAIVGASGMGALEYAPRFSLPHEELPLDFDALAAECTKVLQSEPTTDVELDTLFALGGSSGGARPKALVFLDGVSWIVKFPSSYDPINIGEQEFSYAKAARACGLILPETRLFPSKVCGGYFGVRRFDRPLQADGGETKTHMVSAGGLLETSHRIPNLDYDILMRLTLMLTHSSRETSSAWKTTSLRRNHRPPRTCARYALPHALFSSTSASAASSACTTVTDHQMPSRPQSRAMAHTTATTSTASPTTRRVEALASSMA